MADDWGDLASDLFVWVVYLALTLGILYGLVRFVKWAWT